MLKIFLLFTVGLVSCARFPGVNNDPAKNNRATYQKEFNECKEDYPETPDGVYLKQRISCMNLKGWE